MKLTVWILIAVFLLPGQLLASGDWFVAVYRGEYAESTLGELVREWNPNYIDENIAALAVSNRFHTWYDDLHWEIESQFVSGYQRPRHYEFNLVLVARWDRFPWDKYVDTSFAFGEGLSYANKIPPDERDQDKKSRLLNYLLFELEFSPPGPSKWSLFGRVHHRSGVAGLFSGVHGGSNVLATGIRYRL